MVYHVTFFISFLAGVRPPHSLACHLGGDTFGDKPIFMGLRSNQINYPTCFLPSRLARHSLHDQEDPQDVVCGEKKTIYQYIKKTKKTLPSFFSPVDIFCVPPVDIFNTLKKRKKPYLLFFLPWIYFVSLPWIYFVSLPWIYFVSLPWIYFVSLPWIYFVSLPWIYFVSLPWIYFVCLSWIYFVSLPWIYFVSLPWIYFVCLSWIYFVSLPWIYFVSLPWIYFVSLQWIYFGSLPWIYLVYLPWIPGRKIMLVYRTYILGFIARSSRLQYPCLILKAALSCIIIAPLYYVPPFPKPLSDRMFFGVRFLFLCSRGSASSTS